MIPGGEEAEVKAQKLPVYKKRKCQICCGVAVLLLLALAVVIVVLSQTLFKFRDPRLSIISLKLESISVSVDPFTLSATLNISLATDVGVSNPNHFDFKYSNSTAVLFYHGLQVLCPLPSFPFVVVLVGWEIRRMIFFFQVIRRRRKRSALPECCN
jgi:hypothetical protein